MSNRGVQTDEDLACSVVDAAVQCDLQCENGISEPLVDDVSEPEESDTECGDPDWLPSKDDKMQADRYDIL